MEFAVVERLLEKHSTTCAIEVCDMAPGINDELLKMFFENRRRSGGDKIEDLYYQDKERRAVITFSHPDGCIAL